jgi:hypothetical protein
VGNYTYKERNAMVEPIYYPDHAERYAHLGPRERAEYPDAVKIGMFGTIKRERNLIDLTKEECSRIGPSLIRYAAKDIPLSRANRDKLAG